ncbi:hypothetical protein OJJOAM_000935 [Cupriavidus sp. H18C1]
MPRWVRIGSSSPAARSFGAQRLDMGVHGAVAGVERIVPDQIHQLRARVDTARMVGQQREQPVFVAGQVEPLAAVGQPGPVAIVHEWRRGLLRGLLGGCRWHALAPAAHATQDHADARRQFARRERLDHIVVRADLQSDHAIDLLVARRQENHRHIGKGAQRAADLEAVQVRQAHVEDHQVDRLRAQAGNRFAAQRAMLDQHAFGAQRIEDRIGNGGLVVDHEDRRDMRGVGLHGRACRRLRRKMGGRKRVRHSSRARRKGPRPCRWRRRWK